MSTENSLLEIRLETICEGRADKIAYLTLNRPSSANAFDGRMLDQITQSLCKISDDQSIRVLILNARGKHFSAGADLNWMKDAAKLDFKQNLADANKLVHMFETLVKIKIPTIAIVNGAAFGGAVGLVACCDISIAMDRAKFCLSEARLGLLPAVILPYLRRKMSPGHLKRLGITATVFSGQQAVENGLVELLATDQTIETIVREEIDALLASGREAISRYKSLFDEVGSKSNVQGEYCAQAIAQARVGAEAQAGLKSFFEKKPAPWTLQLPTNWRYHA